MSNNTFIKTVLPSRYDHSDPLSSLVDVCLKGVDSSWIRKKAGTRVFGDLSDIKPEKGHSFVHLIAMGAAPNLPGNRNGDIFYKTACDVSIPDGKDIKNYNVKKGLKDTHSTFVTDAHVYKDHRHNKGDKIYGDVVKSAFHDAAERVELIVKLPDSEWGEELHKMASGEPVAWSMSCTVPYDICSICGNKAVKQSEYCDHLKNHMASITKDGHSINAINDHMTFFDISKVGTPADRIAFGLQKVAALDNVVSAAELASVLDISGNDVYGLNKSSKLSVLRKLSELEKEIEGISDPESPILKLKLSFDNDVYTPIHDKIMQKLVNSTCPVEDILGGFADRKIVLSLRDFMRLISGNDIDKFGPSLARAEQLMPGIFSKVMENDIPTPADSLEFGNKLIPPSIDDIINECVEGCSLDNEPAVRRMSIMVIKNRKPDIRIRKISSAGDNTAELMARAYAKYKIAACSRINDDFVDLMCVVQNYA